MFKKSGARAFVSIAFLFAAFTVLGTLFAAGDLMENGRIANFVHIPIVLYMLIYIDNSVMRYTSPLELTHINVFPQPAIKKYLRLVFIESTGTKMYLIALYLLIQLVVNKLAYDWPVILCILFLYIGYNFIYLPFLLMVKRKVAYLYVFRAFAPVVFVLPMVLLNTKKHFAARYFRKLQPFYDHNQMWIPLVFLGLAIFCFCIGLFCFNNVARKYPFQDEELVEKLKMRKR